jgi:cytochrome c oxidase subunit II
MRMNLNTGSRESTFPNVAGGSIRKGAFGVFRMRLRSSLYFSLSMLLAFSSGFAQPRSGNLYWAPPNYTTGGEQIDSILNFIFWLTLFVFIAVQVVFLVYLVKYRRRPGQPAHYSHGNSLLEVVWTTIPVLIFLGLAIYSNRVWAELHSDPPQDSLQVNVSAFQFGWDFRYPGADGKLGAVDVTKISTENKFGVDENDEAGKDDFTSTELVIPFGKPVHIVLNSRDVIHSFYVPWFRLYQDAVPGRTISWVWFEVQRPGSFELACSQLCGTGHYNMKAPIRVVSKEEYEKWYDGKVKAAASARLGEEAASRKIATK